MKTLIVAATRPEISLLIEHFKLPDGDFMLSDNFDVLITGVGMTATAFALGKHLSSKYALVLNLGIAGCFDYSLPLGTLINIVKDQFSELGAENGQNFISIDELGFGKSTFEVQNKLTNSLITDLVTGTGITVNRVHGEEKSIQDIVKRLNPLTESMEGAAVLYCCANASIPCLQIRSISNYVELRNRNNWKIGLAINHLNQWAISFLTNP